MNNLKRVHIVVSGQVQGVFFRATAKKMADSWGISGWAKNVASGQVEIYAIGALNPISKMVQWCHEGPPKAEVNEVDVHWDQNLGDFSTFEILE